MQFPKRPLFSCTVAASILAGSLVIAPFSLSANGAQVNKTLANRTSTKSIRYSHAAFSIRLEDQLLATLRYLPVKFVSASSSTAPTTTTTTAPTTTTTVASTSTTTPGSTTTVPVTTTTKPKPKPKPKPKKKVNPTSLQTGSFVWRFPKIVGPLRSLWSVGSNNVVLQGALMNFQALHGLSWSTGMTSETWQLILQAAARKQYDPNSYNYVVVAQNQPELMMLYVNGHHVYNSFVNTGVSSAPTTSGTYPVYLRFTVTTMSGTYPGGGTYSDPGIPWVSYFHGGDALHGFLRSQYGFPQSLGCVEMPFANAKHLWPFTPIGTLVSVLSAP
jgi:hypothetical protein